jgi:hypothetical protein
VVTYTAASLELERLNPFVGEWNTEGEMKSHASEQSEKFKATDTYEWLPGGHFLLHCYDADMPDGKVQGIEVIGYSRESDSYPMRSFDSTGNSSLMQGRVDKEEWTFVGETIRFIGGFRDNRKVFRGLWEFLSPDDGSWKPLMDVTLRKV